MSRRFRYPITRDQVVTGAEVEQLRVPVGWDPMEGRYDRILPHSYTHFTARTGLRLVGFLNVLSDGIGDAFLVDLMVHPDFQRQGIGTALVERAVADLTADGIRCIQVTFNPEQEAFYQKCGFHIFRGGIIDNAHRNQIGGFHI
jgi:ribosomal protein S18 acetylase RimI-like enzyme